MEILIGVVVFLLLLVLNHVFRIADDSKDEIRQKDFKDLEEWIDSSLKGYPGRFRYHTQHTVGWTCPSKLFAISITLESRGNSYLFYVRFTCDLPFEFRLKRRSGIRAIKSSTTWYRIFKADNDLTKKMLEQPEIPALFSKLRFYDSIFIHGSGFSGTRSIRTLSDLEEWPNTMGTTITFVRFLLNLKDRKEIPLKGEAVCPYCRDEITGSQNVVSCKECRTVHHQDCWNETDRCSVFGCGNRAELEIR